MKIKWLGTVSSKCDFCNNDMKDEKFFYDFKSNFGPWGLGCEKCFKLHGCGLGTGKGQKFNMVTREKVEG